MNQDELKQLEQDLVVAFPDWFSFREDHKALRVFVSKRGLLWIHITPLSQCDLDILLSVCLDAAKARGWKLRFDVSRERAALVRIYDTNNNLFADGTHEIPAIAAATAILAAHRLEVYGE